MVTGFVPLFRHALLRLDNSLFREETAFMALHLSASTSSLGRGRSERFRKKSLPPFRLDLGSAAVNEQFDTRDETGVIGREEQRHLSNFLGFPHTSHRDGRHNPRNHV